MATCGELLEVLVFVESQGHTIAATQAAIEELLKARDYVSERRRPVGPRPGAVFWVPITPVA